jgi:hypothetical protein
MSRLIWNGAHRKRDTRARGASVDPLDLQEELDGDVQGRLWPCPRRQRGMTLASP